MATPRFSLDLITARAEATRDRGVRRSPVVVVPSRQSEQIGRALRFIDTHLDATLDAATLADRSAMSRHHFHRVFLALVGCGVGSFVTWRRLQRACALLVSGDEPVLEVALAVGYESAQALAKAMRRDLGTTPTAVRRGDATQSTRLQPPHRLSPPAIRSGEHPMSPTRHANLPAGLVALTATARGRVDRSLTRRAAGLRRADDGRRRGRPGAAGAQRHRDLS